MKNEELNQYFEFLTTLSGVNNRNYVVNGDYSEIEIERGNNYYVYNIEREINLGPFGKRLFDYCKFSVSEETLVSAMIDSYPNKPKGEIIRYTYMTLKKLKKERFIK